jgi:hypothetical protein
MSHPASIRWRSGQGSARVDGQEIPSLPFLPLDSSQVLSPIIIVIIRILSTFAMPIEKHTAELDLVCVASTALANGARASFKLGLALSEGVMRVEYAWNGSGRGGRAGNVRGVMVWVSGGGQVGCMREELGLAGVVGRVEELRRVGGMDESRVGRIKEG